MGMQTAAARRLGVAGVTTTFVTGMLTNLIAELGAVASGRSHWRIWVATLACMVIGAAAGAALFIAWRPGAPFVPLLPPALFIPPPPSPNHPAPSPAPPSPPPPL